jgi:hypothetical protein
VGGVGKKQITKLGCEKYFCKVTCWARLEMLLVQEPSSPFFAHVVKWCLWLIG